MKIKNIFFFLAFALLMQSCFLFGKKDKPVDPIVPEEKIEFVTNPQIYQVPANSVNEASGIVHSTKIKNGLWVQEDSDNPTVLHLLSTTGQYLGKIPMPFPNRDWEDIAIGPGPVNNEMYIYLGDIGDNAEVYNNYTIYRFKEPESINASVNAFDKITIEYSDVKSNNNECLMLDPKTKDLYIISKKEFNVKVYKVAYPQSTDKVNVAQLLGTIPYPNIVGGEISLDGTQIILKSYFAIYYWKLKENETIFQALSRSRDVGPAYQPEPQGESICFDDANSGFFTISEKNDYSKPEAEPLRYYARVKK